MPVLAGRFQVGSVGEVSFSRWRSTVDIFFVIYLLLSSGFTMSYWILKLSLCEDAYAGYKPYIDSIAEDPLLSSFPCEDNANTSFFQGKFPLYLNLLHTLPPDALASFQWFQARWWWVPVWVYSRHAFFAGLGRFIFGPVVLLSPILVPDWWDQGGRTLCMILWRMSWPLSSSLRMMLAAAWDRVDPIDKCTIAAHTIGPLLRRSFACSVPWHIHSRVLLFDAASLFAFYLLRHGFQPPSLPWLFELVSCLLLGTFIIMVISVLETELLFRLIPDEVAALDLPHYGPGYAFKRAYTALKSWTQRYVPAVTGWLAEFSGHPDFLVILLLLVLLSLCWGTGLII